MDLLTQLIEQETAKLRILENAVAASRERIQTLRGMQSGSDLDTFLEGRVTLPAFQLSGTATNESGTLKAAAMPKPPSGLGMVKKTDDLHLGMVENPAAPQRRKKGEVKRALLAILDRKEAKHLNALLMGMAAAGYMMGNKRMRAEMWAYKSEGLVESDQPGMFRLSEKGEAFVERQKGESPAATGLSGGTSSGADLV